MLKKKLLNIFIACCVGAAAIVTGCNSAHQIMDKPVSACYRPMFIDGIALSGNQKNDRLRYALSEKASEKNKYTAPAAPVVQSRYADLLGVIPQLLSNNILYNFIDDWYGTRYRLGGVDKRGVDCSAFVQRLYEQVFNTTLLRTAIEQFHFCNIIFDKEELKEGDLVFFQTKGKKRSRITHVGIYLINNFFVHSSSSNGVTISNLNENYWKKKFAGGGKIPKGGKDEAKL